MTCPRCKGKADRLHQAYRDGVFECAGCALDSREERKLMNADQLVRLVAEKGGR